MSSSRLRNGDMAYPRPTEDDCSRRSYRLKERAWDWRSAGRSSALMVDASGSYGLKSTAVPSFISRFQRPDTLYRRNEHISSAAHSRDEALALGAQGLSEIAYLNANIRILHGQVRPHMFEDLSRSDNFAAALYQQHENIEGAAAQLDGVLASEKQAPARN
jgi:hypothetical protein